MLFRYTLILVILIGNSILINALQFLAYPLKYLRPNVYHRFIDITQVAFVEVLMLLHRVSAPTKLIFSGDPILDEPSVIIANHQTYADWIYIWILLYYFRREAQLKIILKESLKFIPVIGWGMQFFDFMFLKRNWESDKPALSHYLNGLSRKKDNSDNSICLLLFPEGTIIHPNTLQKSREYGEREGLKPFEHVLIPRSTGLMFILERFNVSAVYDLTMGYEGVDTSIVSESVITLRRIFVQADPVNVHFLSRRYDISEIRPRLKSKDDFSTFLYNIFKLKNEQMDNFYKDKRLSQDSFKITVGTSIVTPRPSPATFGLFKVWLIWAVAIILIINVL